MFAKSEKYKRGGRFKVEIHTSFCGEKALTVARRQTKTGNTEDNGHTYNWF
jgi:hypothetical protein